MNKKDCEGCCWIQKVEQCSLYLVYKKVEQHVPNFPPCPCSECLVKVVCHLTTKSKCEISLKYIENLIFNLKNKT